MKRLPTEVTPKQARVLDFITRWVQEQDSPPSVQELAQGSDLTEENARDYVFILERKGYLRRQPNMARGLTPLKPPPIAPFHDLPRVGRVIAGRPARGL
jgi:SOS-response transcriptional repressor LexA